MTNRLIFLILTLSTLVAYGGSLRYGFSQDDWFFLLISQKDSWLEITKFFLPWMQEGFPFYRPLGTQLYFYLGVLFGGLGGAPLIMHLFMLLVQAINSYLVYKLLLKLHKSTRLSLAIALLYAISATQFLSLYYIAATQQLLAALFSLLSLNAFFAQKSAQAGLWFLLALMSKENAIMIPVIALIIAWPLSNLKTLFTRFMPYGIFGLFYLVLRLSVPVTIQSEYHFIFGPSVLTNLRWYWLFAYSAPEELVRYGLPRMGIDFLAFIKDYGIRGVAVSFVSVSLSILTLVNLISSKNLKYLLWFVAGILPIVFLQNHLYPHYLDLSTIPLLLLLLEPTSPKTRYILATLLAFSSLIAINLSEDSHWTTKRARHASEVIPKIQNMCADPKGIVFEGTQLEMAELSYTLSLANGPRVICDDPDLEVQYEGLP